MAGDKVFGRFVLEAQVGRGGMGVVWRARDEKLDRLVALKFLPPEVAADAEALRDLKMETRRCLDLTHVNIVRVYDFIEEGSVAAIAMEYIEGESLAKLKASVPGGCLAADDLLPLVGQLCGALSYAHLVAKVVHHDLKPANVLVTREGVVKVTDFGIARSLTETKARLTGNVGTTSGTPAYMSPQQLAGEPPTAADDIYAFGVLLYELLTGKPPFFRGDALSLRQQVLERTPPPLEAHRREVGCSGAAIPAPWSAAILACLAKKPEERPASAEHVAAMLGVVLEPMAKSHARGVAFSTGRGASPPVARPGGRRSLVPWLLGLGAILVAATGTGIYFGVYVPEQNRLAAERERAHQAELRLHAELARQAERARLAEENRRDAEEKRKAAEEQALAERKKEEAARAQMARDQQEYSAMVARIAALTDTTPAQQVNQVERTMRTYLRTAPELYRALVEKAWSDRQAAVRARAAASRPGSLLVETDPIGATIVLYPRNERRTSPALFEDVKPGEITLRIEKEGFESKEVPFVVKPGAATKVEPVKLLPIYGSLTITSEPSDLRVVLDGNDRRLEGRTPFTTALLPPGDYRVTFQRSGWNPQIKTVTIERGKSAEVFGNLTGFNLELVSKPAGAQLVVERLPIGAAPKTIVGLEPRDYQVTATLEGYDVLHQTIKLTGNDRVVLTMPEKPLQRALRKIAGVRWRYESFGTSAELSFNAQGKITGSHRFALGSQVRDIGSADSFNASTNTVTAHFTANAAKALYAGNVQIKPVDDDHLAVSWTAGGTLERLVFQREKSAK